MKDDLALLADHPSSRWDRGYLWSCRRRIPAGLQALRRKPGAFVVMNDPSHSTPGVYAVVETLFFFLLGITLLASIFNTAISVNKSRPTGIKGIYLKKVAVSSTMGIGVRVDQGSTQG